MFKFIKNLFSTKKTVKEVPKKEPLYSAHFRELEKGCEKKEEFKEEVKEEVKEEPVIETPVETPEFVVPEIPPLTTKPDAPIIVKSDKNILKAKCTKDMRVTSFYGNRNTGIEGASTYHLGIDMGGHNYKTEPVLAVMDGIVSDSYFNKARGWVVTVYHGLYTIDGKTSNIYTLYQHLAEQGLPKETKVKAGDKVGQMGNTGTGASLHLHMEIIVDGIPVNPLPFIIDSFDSMEIKHTISKKSTQWVLEIKRLQECLKELGYYKGKIDGRVGDQMVEAIGKFQKAHGLTVDKSFGKECIDYLYKMYNGEGTK